MALDRIYLVAPGVLGLTAGQVRERLEALFGTAIAQALSLTDAELERARAGGLVDKAARVPVEHLPGVLRAHLRRNPPHGVLPVWVHVHPWVKTIETGRVDDQGMPVLQVERLGTLVDVLFRGEDMDVRGLEAAFLAALAQSDLTTSSGREMQAGADDSGLRLIPAEHVLSPYVVYPAWSPPEMVTDTELVVPPEG